MELTIDQALRRGIAAQSEGQLRDAERFYRSILKVQPNHPDANHNLGVLAVSVGKLVEAVPLFKLAVAANPKIEQFWLSYIDALIKAEHPDEARRILVEGERYGVCSEKLQPLRRQIRKSSTELEVNREQILTVSEEREKLTEKKESKKKKNKESQLVLCHHNIKSMP